MGNQERPLWNPYVAGVALGLVLLASFVFMGFGLGASSGPTRIAYWFGSIVAPAATETSAYVSGFFGGEHILADWMVFEVLGVFLGGAIGAYTGGRMKRGTVEKGPRISTKGRIFYAILGGMMMGVGARLGRGCTSGQALTGGATLAAGSWVFMMMVFAGGYAFAPLMRKQWR
jgi:uncharacterized protein